MAHPKLILTCEHATYEIPPKFQKLFMGQIALLQSHRGWDRGAKEIARGFAKQKKAPLIVGSVSRLLADLNRTPNHAQVFSEFTRPLGQREKHEILRKHHFPHWQRVEALVRKQISRHGAVIHLGVHSFTPILHGKARAMDLGLLFDPKRKREVQLCEDWRSRLEEKQNLKVHLNRPYRGTGNGLISFLRTIFPPANYLGVEVEVNQRIVKSHGKNLWIGQLLANTIFE